MRPELQKRFVSLLLQVCAFFTLGRALLACSSLPSLRQRQRSLALSPRDDTHLGRAIAPLKQQHPERSGVFPLRDAPSAFASRILLAAEAELSLDVQYYIWKADKTGTLLFQALYAAAERGVRVRLLLDDNNTQELDALLSTLDAHPQIEVRLFNPFMHRRARIIDYLSDFSRLNRRMHNKSFTVDGQATIVGGRNIGDEYFGATDDVVFADLDILAVGPIVELVASDFDRYWNSDSAYPLEGILPPAAAGSRESLAAAAQSIAVSDEARVYRQALEEATIIRELVAGHVPFEWTEVRLVSDDPAKALGEAPHAALIGHALREVIGEPQNEVDLVSPYFVPLASGVDAFARLSKSGVRVRILTNALEATDVALVHAGYAKRRRALLKAGVKLYEFRRRVEPQNIGGKRKKFFGSSGTSLHAKTFAVDGQQVFVGSFNFDPRSARLNTEMGFVIESPRLADQIRRAFEQEVPLRAYEVSLSSSGELLWIEAGPGGSELVHTEEPGTSRFKSFMIWVFSQLPIERLL